MYKRLYFHRMDGTYHVFDGARKLIAEVPRYSDAYAIYNGGEAVNLWTNANKIQFDEFAKCYELYVEKIGDDTLLSEGVINAS